VVDAVWEGGVVVWQSGTGILEQTWSGEDGWKLTTAFTSKCTSIVEKCVIDAKASYSSTRRVLGVEHDRDVFSYFVGLVIRGAYYYYVSRHSTQYFNAINTNTPSAGGKQS